MSKGKRQAPFQGSIKASHIPIGVGIASLFGIAFSYIMAQVQGSEPPFPGASITNTSNHYPQFIVFRICEEGSALFMIFIWLVEYYWIKQRAEEIEVTLILPELQLLLGLVSSVLFILSTASIDTGDMNGHFHQICATWFFITIMVNFLFNFISYCQFKCKKEESINENSFYLKLFVNVLDITLVSLESQNIPHYNNIQEYIGVVAMMLYMLTFSMDWAGYNIKFSIQNPRLFSLEREQFPPHLMQYGYAVQQPQIYYAPSAQQQHNFMPTVHAASPMGQAMGLQQQPICVQPQPIYANIQRQPIYHQNQPMVIVQQQPPFY